MLKSKVNLFMDFIQKIWHAFFLIFQISRYIGAVSKTSAKTTMKYAKTKKFVNFVQKTAVTFMSKDRPVELLPMS